MDFLTTAANNFKYSFQEQLLIFAQKPDATACAEVSWWNKHGRWVNRNTKGIALLVDTDAPYKLRHVFDVSDTNSRAGKEVPIWKMEQRFVEPVKKVLAERYEVDAHESLEDCLLNVAVTFVNDNYQDYLTELMEAKAGSLLEKLDEDNTRLQMLTALSYSVGYITGMIVLHEQMSYITNADAGCGLIKYGSALVPFINRFPQNTKLYELMTTRPGEGQFAHGQE